MRHPPSPARAADDGTVGLLTVVGGVLSVAVAVAILAAAADVGVAAARARTAADAAALAAAGASPLAGGDGDARAAAGHLAAANGARLVACCQPAVDRRGGPVAQVEVSVAPDLALVRASIGAVRARAAASLRPRDGFVDHATLAAGLPDVPATSSGRLQHPVHGHLTSGFGWRIHPVRRAPRLHTGADFAAPTGAPVVAAEDGHVRSAGWRGGYGIAVLVDHGGGVGTLYAHLSRTVVARGDRVERGEVVGAVGCTGTCTGPHLHFEVRVGGQPRDPVSYLR